MKKWKRAEKFVKKKLEEEHGQEFEKKSLELGKEREFDFVSEDGEVVGQLKTIEKNFEDLNSQQRWERLYRLIYDCNLLEKVSAERKIMAFVDEPFYEWFVEESEGLVREEVKIRFFAGL